MPKVRFEDKEIEAPQGAILRKVLKDAGLPIHNGGSKNLNCTGLGTCGTCCVFIEGEVSPKTKVETWRLGFPPHKNEAGKRLACQVRIQGDIKVRKGKGFWGQEMPD